MKKREDTLSDKWGLEAAAQQRELDLKPSTLRAKKNFVINHNDYVLVIKEGEEMDLSKIPELYHANLKAEGVIE